MPHVTEHTPKVSTWSVKPYACESSREKRQQDRQTEGRTDRRTDRQTLRRIVQNRFSRRFGGCTSQIRSYLEVDFLHDANTSIDMEVIKVFLKKKTLIQQKSKIDFVFLVSRVKSRSSLRRSVFFFSEKDPFLNGLLKARRRAASVASHRPNLSQNSCLTIIQRSKRHKRHWIGNLTVKDTINDQTPLVQSVTDLQPLPQRVELALTSWIGNFPSRFGLLAVTCA